MTARRTWLVGSALVAVAVFALMWAGYALRWSWLTAGDTAALDATHRIAVGHPAWVSAWNLYSTVFGPTVFRVAGLVVVVVALIRRRLQAALFVVVTVELSGLLTQLVKEIADRPRPSTALVAAHSTAFPSGHAVGVLVCVLAFLTLGLPMVRPAWRGRAVAVGVLIVVTIGVGRVVLNVHHPSDVVAGWALGWAYFAACLLLVPPVRRISPAGGTPAALDTAR